MKSRPIMFSSDMVRAILEGKKCQTRRMVKPQPLISPARYEKWARDTWIPVTNSGKAFVFPSWRTIRCPFGAVGDRMWVRETWAELEPGRYCYATDSGPDGYQWRPSMFMPRTASRITLDILGIRIEKLQVIAPVDAICEGCSPLPPYNDPVDQFKKLWNSINCSDGRQWEDNPWVWVIDFSRYAL